MTVNINPKSLFTSKTFWFNVLAGAILLANAFGFANFTVDPHVAEGAGIAINIINIILRLKTHQPIG